MARRQHVVIDVLQRRAAVGTRWRSNVTAYTSLGHGRRVLDVGHAESLLPGNWLILPSQGRVRIKPGLREPVAGFATDAIDAPIR